MSDTTEIIGALISVTTPEDEDPGIWSATQTGPDDLPPNYDLYNGQSFEWTHGPIKFRGYVDPETLDTSIATTVAGTFIGIISGNVKDGFGVKFDLFTARGNINFYLKYGVDEEDIQFPVKILVKNTVTIASVLRVHYGEARTSECSVSMSGILNNRWFLSSVDRFSKRYIVGIVFGLDSTRSDCNIF
ncbi:hypothetical protein VPNG_06372 [Cytospora leucostoma]|uniref:Uncharacterized protein n=1 Tax=Cytospora leucostoma TaxID=1230097 RepID=A0A423WYT0_9PEZI|nr:hypothetical protein VPNG_06372 [Cytospora leucostoma]